jgi:hypothetical protein
VWKNQIRNAAARELASNVRTHVRLAYTRLTIGKIKQWLFDERRPDGRCPNLARSRITKAANEIMRQALLNVSMSWIEEDDEENNQLEDPEGNQAANPGNPQAPVIYVCVTFANL